MKILIADDDRDQLMIRGMLLRQAGFEVVAASDEASALEAARKGHPGCAIVDLKFPDEQSGLRLIRGLKALHADMIIVVLTGASLARLNSLPERALIHEVIGKGSPASLLLGKLQELQRVGEKIAPSG